MTVYEWGVPHLPAVNAVNVTKKTQRQQISRPLIASFMIWTESYTEGYLSVGQQVHYIPAVIASWSWAPHDFKFNLNIFKLL